MRLGWKIFTHSVRQLLLNLGPAMRISAAPMLIASAVFYFGMRPYLEQHPVQTGGWNDFVGEFFLRLILVMLVYAFLSIWVAVAWHRFVLLSEYPGRFVARFHSDRMWSYFGASIRVVLVVIVLGMVVLVVMSIVVSLFRSMTGALTLIQLVIQTVFSVLIMRFSVILPAAAIGERLTLAEAFQVTVGHNMAVFVAAVLISVLTMIPIFLVQTPLAPLVTSLVYQICANWLIFMLSISILTTLYGHFVERRELV